MSLSSNESVPSVQIINGIDPVCCPPIAELLWNMHPRVYLSCNSSGKVSCPYCGRVYQMDGTL